MMRTVLSASASSRLRPVPALALSAFLLVGCAELLVEPAPPSPAALAVSLSLATSPHSGGPGEAYDKADRIQIGLVREGAVPIEVVRRFVSGAAETRISLTVELANDSEPGELSVELFRDDASLFRGQTAVVLRAGETTAAEVSLAPVPAQLRITSKPVAVITSLGDNLQLTAEASFATGESIPGLPLQWSTTNPAVVDVNSDGTVTATAEGNAEIRVSHEELWDTVRIAVRQVVASLELSPDTATVQMGQTLQLSTMLRDARGHQVHGRTLDTWASSAPGVARVDASGLVTAVALGNATITATIEAENGSGDVSGTSAVAVTASPPSVSTDTATAVSASSATLNGSVNPQGVPTQARFEWGTTQNLGQSTAQQSVGSGTTAQTASTSLSGLNPNTTYYFRIVASSGSGTSQGAILSFRTLPVAPAAPSTLVAMALGATQIQLTWTDHSDSEQGFRIERCEGASCTTFQEVATVASNITTWSDAGLRAQTSYRYRVRAYNSAGTSAYSNIAQATTPDSPPSAPGQLSASDDGGIIYLDWQDNSNNEDGFHVERRTGSAGIWARIASVGANATRYVDADSSLIPNTTYHYRVQAFNAGGTSSFSNEAVVTIYFSNQWFGFSSATPEVAFGGGSFCSYTAYFAFVEAWLRLDDGSFEGSGLQAEYNEFADGDCREPPPIEPNSHFYSAAEWATEGYDVTIQFSQEQAQRATGNTPEATLVFRGVISSDGSRVTGTFTWTRTDGGTPELNWTISEIMELRDDD